jgi:Ca2+-binding RTX toxin-like protein
MAATSFACADLFVGGSVTDGISAFGFGPVVIDLTLGARSGGGPGLTRFRKSRPYGSAEDDTLIGDREDYNSDGLGGDDHVEGRDGDDFLEGGPGDDSLDGGTGTDTCVEGETVLNCEA